MYIIEHFILMESDKKLRWIQSVVSMVIAVLLNPLSAKASTNESLCDYPQEYERNAAQIWLIRINECTKLIMKSSTYCM